MDPTYCISVVNLTFSYCPHPLQTPCPQGAVVREKPTNANPQKFSNGFYLSPCTVFSNPQEFSSKTAKISISFDSSSFNS
jgi:hypothetical protein